LIAAASYDGTGSMLLWWIRGMGRSLAAVERVVGPGFVVAGEFLMNGREEVYGRKATLSLGMSWPLGLGGVVDYWGRFGNGATLPVRCF
jgi:hypothetical protein